MASVFINYRTGDEETSARLIERELSHRFGTEKIFWDSKSIPLGEFFEGWLIRGVRECGALIAVIGSRWFTVAQRHGQPTLDPATDWTCREIVEALRHGIRVIPVLVGVDSLDPAALPPALVQLASCQYLRLTQRSLEADLVKLGDRLADLVPGLAPATPTDESTADSPPAPPTVHMRDRGSRRRGGVGNIVGNVGTLVTDARGPIHTGSGNQYNGATGPNVDCEASGTAD